MSSLNATDSRALKDLCSKAFPDEPFADLIPEALIDGRSVVVATNEKNRELVGAGIWSRSSQDEDAPAVLDLLLVDPHAWGAGLGSSLLARVEYEALASGAQTLRVAGQPPTYAWPGVDVSNIRAIGFFDRRGYVRQQIHHNLRVNFSESLSVRMTDANLTQRGINLCAAPEVDQDWIAGEIGQRWKPEWLAEVAIALRKARVSNASAGAHFAIADGQCVAFAAWGVSRPHELGPAGTVPEYRGRGIGESLLRACMADQRISGLSFGELKWAGPLSWFARRFDAQFSCAYLTYAKELL